KTSTTLRRPYPCFSIASAAACHRNAVGDHEGCIKADTELADQARAFLAFIKAIDERLCAGAGNGAEIVDQLLPLHADAGVGDGERARVLVRNDADCQRPAILKQFWRGDSLIAQLVAGVRSVGDQ